MFKKIREFYIYFFRLRYFVCKQRVENLTLKESYYLFVNADNAAEWVSEPKHAVVFPYIVGCIFCYHFRKKETFGYEYVLVTTGDVAFMEDVFNNQHTNKDLASA